MSSFEATDTRIESRFIPEPLTVPTGFRVSGDGSAEPGAAAEPPPRAPIELDTRPACEEELAAEYERGCADGRAVAEAALESPIEALCKATRELAVQRTLYLHEQRGLLVQLALSIAGKVVERELATDPELLAGMVSRAIAKLDRESPIVVQLSSADHGEVTAGRRPALAALTAAGDVRIDPSSELAAGEARVVSGATTVEARMASMLEHFGEELVDFDGITAPTGEGDEPA